MNSRTQNKDKSGSAPAKPLSEPINISSAEFTMLRERAAACGLSVEMFVRTAVLDFAGRLDPERLVTTPCPFCHQTDSLEIISWSHGRPDGTEYIGDAVKCNRCEVVASAPAWARVALNRHGAHAPLLTF